MDAVGADQQVATHLPSVSEAGCYGGLTLLDGDTAGVEGDLPLAEDGTQRIVQIGTVQVVEGCAPASDCLLIERHPAEQRTSAPVARIERERADANPGERVCEPEVMQHPRGIRAERDPSAHLTQYAGLLVDLNIESRLPQCQGGSQATDPGSNDQNLHSALLPDFPLARAMGVGEYGH